MEGNILLTSSLPLSRTEKDSKRGPSTIESEEGNPGKQHGKTKQRTKERSKPTPRNPQEGRPAKAWTPTFLVVHDHDDDDDGGGDDDDDDDDDDDGGDADDVTEM